MIHIRNLVLGSCILVSVFSCRESQIPIPESQPRIFALTVSDMEKSMDWYTRHLAFTRDTVMSFPAYGITVGMMHQGEFYIELVQFEDDLSPADLQFTEGATALNGFFKIGFQTADIDALYNELSNQSDVRVLAPLDDLIKVEGIPWPDRYFLLTDPDGNYVQFFSLSSGQAQPETLLRPFLIASSSQDLDRSIQWYQKHLEARLIDRVGNPGNERAILDKGGLMIELGTFDGFVPLEQLEVPEGIGLSKVHGIRKLSFLVPDIHKPYELLKSAGVPFSFDLTERKSMAGDRYFMVSDDAGNALQFFEKDQ